MPLEAFPCSRACVSSVKLGFGQNSYRRIDCESACRPAKAKVPKAPQAVDTYGSLDSEDSLTTRLDTIAEQGESQCTPLADTPLKSRVSGSHRVLHSWDDLTQGRISSRLSARMSLARLQKARYTRMMRLRDSGEQFIFAMGASTDHPADPAAQVAEGDTANASAAAQHVNQPMLSVSNGVDEHTATPVNTFDSALEPASAAQSVLSKPSPDKPPARNAIPHGRQRTRSAALQHCSR